MRIGIVNDLPLAREALRRAVSSAHGHEVAWLARDGAEAVALARSDRPDMILMDLIMPGVDGVEATRRIMAQAPCPILVVTATVSGHLGRVYEAMGLGALDAVDTPALGPSGDMSGASPLLAKIATIAKLVGRSAPAPPPIDLQPSHSDEVAATCPLVAIGASTGGPAAVAEVLRDWPVASGASMVIVQHVDQAFAPGLARWLGEKTGREVTLIRPGDRPKAGRIFLAATNDHVILDDHGRLRYDPEPASSFFRPSADVFFASIARNWPRVGVAVLLTGMGRDGAVGMLALRRAGWLTIAQDEATSVIWGMPGAAVEIGPAGLVLPIDQIAGAITARLGTRV